MKEEWGACFCTGVRCGRAKEMVQTGPGATLWPSKTATSCWSLHFSPSSRRLCAGSPLLLARNSARRSARRFAASIISCTLRSERRASCHILATGHSNGGRRSWKAASL